MLTIIEEFSRREEKLRHRQGRLRKFLRVRCECGTEKEILKENLPRTTSCGCYARLLATRHGMCRTRTYRSWQMMLDRCSNTNNPMWENYGGRGITVCKRWTNFHNFLMDMGVRPPHKSIDRIDNSLGYYKENCQWSTHAEQMQNTRANHLVAVNGITLNVSQWARKYGFAPHTFNARIKNGWPPEDAATTPPQYSGYHRRIRHA